MDRSINRLDRRLNEASVETYRRELKLTRLQAQVYDVLLTVGPQDALDLSLAMDCSPHAVYSLANALVRRGFVSIDRTKRPRIFVAVPLEYALPAVAVASQAEQATVQANMMGEVLRGTRSPVLALLNGRRGLYDRYIVEARKARSEILVFAIGIAYSNGLYAVQQEARQRGVEVRHIVQQHAAGNYYIVKKWQRLGVKLRYYPAPFGFHLIVFDGKTVLLSLSNPDDTGERTSLVMQGRAVGGAMRDHFFELWAKAKLLSY